MVDFIELFKAVDRLRNFLHSALLLVVIVEVAILAFSFGIDESIGMRASICKAVSSILVVAMVAHPLGIVLLIFVRAL